MRVDPSQQPRRRWPWIVAAAVAVVAVVIAAVIFWPREDAPVEPPPTAEPSTSPSTEPSTDADPAPTGCLVSGLAGSMVTDSQAAAPQTVNGAVEVAAALTRFTSQFPYPSSEDVALVDATVIASPDFTLAEFYASEPDLTGDYAPPGTPLHYSTIGGSWYVESYDGETARVSIVSSIVVDGAVLPNVFAATGTVLEWTEAGWASVGGYQPDAPAELQTRTAPFNGGC